MTTAIETRKFPLNVVLTVTTGRLLTKSCGPDDNGIGDLYDLLGWMTDDSPYTHQLPRFCSECKPWLLAQFPRLAELHDQVIEACDSGWKDSGAFASFVEGMMWGMGERIGMHKFKIPKGCVRSHVAKNPITELAEMMERKP